MNRPMSAGRGGNMGPPRAPPENNGRRPTTLNQIQQLERDRENRRVAAQQRRNDRAAEERRNLDAGKVGDVDFMRFITKFRQDSHGEARPHSQPFHESKVAIGVRKRPISEKESAKQDFDIVTCLNPRVVVHHCKRRVDGITKYLDNQPFEFDHAFGEECSTEVVYKSLVQPLVQSIVHTGGRATVFAYGQTGSGKTHTMVGIQAMAVSDLFEALDAQPALADVQVLVSFFEIYGPKCQDLLNGRKRLAVREDGRGEVHVAGLELFEVGSAGELHQLIARGNQLRTTQATESNDTSSRSHAICQVTLRRATGRLLGQLSLVDLAGSERGQDTLSHNRQLRTESAEINKSLLALKECIRGIATGSAHVPFRASKLTMVLRDSFVRPRTKVAMIATVSPGASVADHTLNTLRYTVRVKEKPATDRDTPDSFDAVPQAFPLGPSHNVGGGGGGSGGGVPPSTRGDRQNQNHMLRAEEKNAYDSDTDGAKRDGGSSGGGGGSNSSRSSDRRRPASAAAARGGFARSAASSGGSAGGGGAVSGNPLLRRSHSPIGPAPGKRNNHNQNNNNNGRLATTPVRRTQNSHGGASAASAAAEGSGRGMGGRGSERGVGDGPMTWDDEDEEETVDGSGGGEEGEGGEDEEWLSRSLGGGAGSAEVAEMHKTVESLFEEEEQLLAMHMQSIQENAKLLTEEGRLLQSIQGVEVVDYDIDGYAQRLQEILDRKAELVEALSAKLVRFRGQLKHEEQASHAASNYLK